MSFRSVKSVECTKNTKLSIWYGFIREKHSLLSSFSLSISSTSLGSCKSFFFSSTSSISLESFSALCLKMQSDEYQ